VNLAKNDLSDVYFEKSIWPGGGPQWNKLAYPNVRNAMQVILYPFLILAVRGRPFITKHGYAPILIADLTLK